MITRYFRQFLLVCLGLLLALTAVSADFPSVELPSTDLGSGSVDLELRVSSGVQASVFINDELLSRQDVIANPVFVNLSDSVPDVSVPVGSRVIFTNRNASHTYAINISGELYRELSEGDSVEFPSNTEGSFTYRDENSGKEGEITFTDTLQNVTFNDAQSLLTDGSNSLRVELKHPLSTLSETSTTQFSAQYEKYSVDITIQNATNITNIRRANVEGFISDGDAPLFYVINKEEIVNPGIMNSVNVDGNSFNISTDNLNEGNNTIRFIATEPGNQNVFTGEREVEVYVDTRPPRININSSFREYTNEQQLVLNITTDDATELNYSFGGKNTTVAFENGSVTLDLSLEEGENPLVLTAKDIAGNTAKERHNIKFSKEKPDVVDRSLEPENIFQEGGDAHFFFQKMSGNTTKPNVDMTIFTLPEGATDSEGERLTCGNYENLFLRNLGQLDRDAGDDEGPELNLEERQVSLLGAIHKRIDTSSDSNGNFDAVIGLQEKNFDRGDYEDAREQDRNPEVGDVSSDNRICIFMHDKYGNTRMREYDVTLDAGNTQWRPGEVTTIPNTVYAAEIENQGDVRSGDGRGQIEFSMIARFNYIGPGQVTRIQDPIIDVDNNGARDTDHVGVDMSRMNYRLDKDTGEMVVHVPVTIEPLDKSPSEYPDSLKMAFQLSGLAYEVDDEDIPIDNRNPVYFQTEVNIERPLDHTKWLTPEMINQTIGFLNQSIALTKKAKEWTGTAAVGGVLACTAAKFWYGVEVAEAQTLPEEEREAKMQEAKRQLFMICDRVACTASPPSCKGDIAGFDDDSQGSGIFQTNGKDSFGQDETLSEAQILRETNNPGEPDKLAQFESLRVGGQCTYGKRNVDGETEEIDGRRITGKVTQYEDSSDGFWSSSEQTGTKLVNDVCVPAQTNSSGDVTALDLKGATGVCFKEGPPNYDETRCNFFGADPNGVPGYNPADNLIESVRCGCITDTYSHLKNYLKIQEGIKKCLEQARIGEVEGSYCERLMGQAVCDVATNVLFNTIGQKTSRTGTDGKDPHENILSTALSGAQQGDQVLNDRYEGTFYSQAGLGTQNIVNKVCLGAISGDWSVLSENILSSIDQNEVEPTFGPSFPKSRIQGYNPLTGEMSVMYRFTYGVVSGGQRIQTEANFICDPSQPGGEYCPNEVVTAEEAGADIGTRLRVSEDQSTQRTVVVTDEAARFKYNVLELVHTYSVKGEQQTKRVEEKITHMGEFILGSCYFSAGTLGSGAGYSCDSLFTNDALMSVYRINDDKTGMAPDPEKKVYYPGNDVTVDLHYYIRDGSQNLHEQTGFDLAWKAVCRGSEGAEASAVDFESIRQGHDNALVSLFEVPQLGTQQDVASSPFSITLNSEQANILNRRIKQDEEVEVRIVNTAGTSGQSVRVESGSFIEESSAAIGQSLTVNQGSENPYASFTIDRDENFSTQEELSLSLEQQTENIIVRLVGLDEEGNEEIFALSQGRTQDVEDQTTFDNLQPGTCELTLKMLPPGDGEQITRDNFDDFNPRGEDIETNVGEGQNIYEDTFTIKNTPGSGEDQFYAFGFTKPSSEQKFCLEREGPDGNKQIPTETLTYLYQTSQSGEDPFDMELDYTITAQRYSGNFGSGEGISLTQNEESSSGIELDIPNNIKPATSDSGVTAFPTLDLDLTLGYTLTGKENGNGAREQLKTGTINFGARVAESCSATGQSQLGDDQQDGGEGDQDDGEENQDEPVDPDSEQRGDEAERE